MIGRLEVLSGGGSLALVVTEDTVCDNITGLAALITDGVWTCVPIPPHIHPKLAMFYEPTTTKEK